MVSQTKFDWSLVGAIILCFSTKERKVEKSDADFKTVLEFIEDEGLLFPRNSDIHTFSKFAQAVGSIEDHGITYTTLGEITENGIKTVLKPTELFAPTAKLKELPMYSGKWDSETGYGPCTLAACCIIIHGLINNVAAGKPKRSRDSVKSLLHQGNIKFPGNSTIIGHIFAYGGGKGDANSLIRIASGPAEPATTSVKHEPAAAKKSKKSKSKSSDSDTDSDSSSSQLRVAKSNVIKYKGKNTRLKQMVEDLKMEIALLKGENGSLKFQVAQQHQLQIQFQLQQQFQNHHQQPQQQYRGNN